MLWKQVRAKIREATINIKEMLGFVGIKVETQYRIWRECISIPYGPWSDWAFPILISQTTQSIALFLFDGFMLAILHDFKQNLEPLALNCHAKDCCPFLRVGQNNGVVLIYNTHFPPVKSSLIALIILLRSAKTFSLQVPIDYYFIWVFLFLSPHLILLLKEKAWFHK